MTEDNLHYVYQDYAPSGKLSAEAVEMVRRHVDVSLKKPDRFPSKLSEILGRKDFAHIIVWQPHGRSFKVLDKIQMEQLVLPMYFETTNYNSFVRLLNAWQFRRVRKRGQDTGKSDQGSRADDDDYNSYYHELFLRGHPGLTNSMRRLQRHNDRKIPMNPEDEPDFAVLAPLTKELIAHADDCGALDIQGTFAPEQKPLKKRALVIENEEDESAARNLQEDSKDNAWKRHKMTDDAAVVTPAECHGNRSSPLNADALKKVGTLPLSSEPFPREEFQPSLTLNHLPYSLATRNVIPEYVGDRPEVSVVHSHLFPHGRGFADDVQAALGARSYYHQILLSGALRKASLDLALKRAGLSANGFLERRPAVFVPPAGMVGYLEPSFPPRNDDRRLALLLSLMNKQSSNT